MEERGSIPCFNNGPGFWGPAWQSSEQVHYPPEPKVPLTTFQQLKSSVFVFQFPFQHWFISYRGTMLACVYTAKWRRLMGELRCSRAVVRCPGTVHRLDCAKNISSWHLGELHEIRLLLSSGPVQHCPQQRSSVSTQALDMQDILVQYCKSTILMGWSKTLKLF